MLTSDEKVKIYKDAILGRPLQNQEPEAQQFHQEMLREVEAAKAKGLVLDVPFEWPD